MEMDKRNWPEKYDINKLVTIQEDIHKIIRGDKISVRRNDRYADPGDKFELNGNTVLVQNVYPQKLGDMTEENAQQEGYDSLESYINRLTKIHGEKVFVSDVLVWVHILKPV